MEREIYCSYIVNLYLDFFLVFSELICDAVIKKLNIFWLHLGFFSWVHAYPSPLSSLIKNNNQSQMQISFFEW